ncbi:MFS transporter [Streptomyces sp. DH10]|uniref:MFS transporter n=1 Tax=Streptomyces sp. DH10 TaxID=3040121 RepID=UPI002442781E|nr:MFS transporter [Streptomyces sp. DH10]MDG9710590.1 MFS transporter [Streptomyces sp. DH10]
MPHHTTAPNTPSPPLTAPDSGLPDARTQKRVIIVLFASQVLSGLGLAAGTTVAALLVQDMLHSTALAGLSSGLLTAGSALAAIAVGRLSQARGRRPGLAAGYLVGAFGAAGVIAAAVTNSPALLFVALFLYGAGTAVNLQARYAGVDLAAPAHRARAISTVLVATTLGGVAGPALAGPTGDLADALGLPSLTGLFVIATVAFTLAALVLMIWLAVEAGRGVVHAFIPQSHRPGAEAEADFGDVKVRLAGEQVTCFVFAMRLSYSGKAVHRVFASCGQEAFLEGHVHALSVLGGVPTGKVRYDNLRSAVSRVLSSRSRVENERWTAFRSHFGIEAAYCLPGIEGAHEKGGVEGQIGWFRRNHMVPVPEVVSLAELNAMIERWDEEDERRRIGSRPRPVSEYFAVERPLLQPLPDEPFETGRLFSLRVDRFSQISVRTNRYSVPVRLIGRTVRAMLHAAELVVYDGQLEVARHERLIAKGQARLDLDHYLEALVRKPGAFPGATALEQARGFGREVHARP